MPTFHASCQTWCSNTFRATKWARKRAKSRGCWHRAGLRSSSPPPTSMVAEHVGATFAHWIYRNPQVLGKYLSASYLVGVGYWRSDQSRGGRPTVSLQAWASRFVNEFNDRLHYSSRMRWARAFTDSGCVARNQSHGLASFAEPVQVRSILQSACNSTFMRSVINAAVELRLGVVLEVTK